MPLVKALAITGIKGWYPGWRMVLASSLIHVLTGGLYHIGFSAYFLPLRESFQVSNAKLSLLFSMRSLEGGVDGPLAGYLADRFGARFVVLTGVALAGAGFILMGLTSSFLMFGIVFLGILTVGFAFPVHGTMVSINQWFRKRMGTAISISTAGSAIGGFALTPLVAYVVFEHGWRTASILSGIVVLVVGIPASLLFRKPVPGETSPEDLARPPAGPHAPDAGLLAHDGDFTVGEAVRTRTYWLIAATIGFRLVVKSAVTVHFFPILVDQGVSELTAVSLLALMSALRLPAVSSAGYIGDRWSLSKMSSISMGFGVLAIAVMLFGPSGLWAGVIFATLLAVSQGSDAMSWGLLGVYFGRAHYGKIRGLLSIAQAGFSAFGPLLVGITVDRTGTYDIALWVLLGVSALSGALYWSLTPPPRPARKAVPAA